MFRQLKFLLMASVLFHSIMVNAQTLPLWEVGAGVLTFQSNHYRGSPEDRWRYFPLVAYTYRGKEVEAENGFVRGHLIKGKNAVLDLSFSLGLNVNSDANMLRKGMDDLDPTFELGPIFRYYLWKSKNNLNFLNLEMPYRAVYTTNLRYIDHIGYYSVPYLNFLSKGNEATAGWTTEVSLGIQYGSKSFHNHFYGVDTEDTNAIRGYYHSTRGYSGSQLTLIFSKRIENFLIIPFFRYDYLDGAVYNESPLYKTPHYTFYGLNIVWFFAKSGRMQEAPTMVK